MFWSSLQHSFHWRGLFASSYVPLPGLLKRAHGHSLWWMAPACPGQVWSIKPVPQGNRIMQCTFWVVAVGMVPDRGPHKALKKNSLVEGEKYLHGGGPSGNNNGLCVTCRPIHGHQHRIQNSGCVNICRCLTWLYPSHLLSMVIVSRAAASVTKKFSAKHPQHHA